MSLIFVPSGFVLVRVRVQCTGGCSLHWHGQVLVVVRRRIKILVGVPHAPVHLGLAHGATLPRLFAKNVANFSNQDKITTKYKHCTR